MFYNKLRLHHRTIMKSALAASAPLAFRVREDPLQPATNPIAERQRFEKTFALEQPAQAKVAPAIHRLVVSSPGLTFVSFDASAPPSVKISAEHTEAINAIEIAQLSDVALEIRVANGVTLERQYMLTEVSLPSPDALHQLEVRGCGTVVLADGVLATTNSHNDVHVYLGGSGDVFVTSNTAIQAKSLSIEVSGSGDIELSAPSITVSDQLHARVKSSGDIRVFTSELRGPQIAVTAVGSGDLQLTALGVDASHSFEASVAGSGSVVVLGDEVQARSIRTTVAGSGDVTVVAAKELVADDFSASVSGSGDICVASADARCRNGKLSVSGSGVVDTRDLVVQLAEASVTGSGDVLLRAGEQLNAYTGGSGDVTVVGALPARVNGRVKAKTIEAKPSLVDKLSKKRHEPSRTPTRADAFEQLMRFEGTFNVRSFSDFLTAIKILWNHKSGDKIEIRAGSGVESP